MSTRSHAREKPGRDGAHQVPQRAHEAQEAHDAQNTQQPGDADDADDLETQLASLRKGPTREVTGSGWYVFWECECYLNS